MMSCKIIKQGNDEIVINKGEQNGKSFDYVKRKKYGTKSEA
jgi:hypothetical protein